MTRAFAASLIATAIVSAMIYANAQTGFIPDLDFLREIEQFNARLGLPTTVQATWMTHVIIGTVIYGIAFAFLQPILPGTPMIEGLVFGVIIWLAMMLSFMPLAGNEIFAQDLGPLFMGATLILHLVYGLTLGVTYDVLSPTDE